MAIDFKGKDVIHKIAVKFTPAYLPEAKKAYNLKTAQQQELDVHGIASKAELYNVAVPAKVIEDGLNAGLELMYYLAADGYKIKTPLFTLRIRVPGEYDGSETHLYDGTFPVARLQASADFRAFIKERVQIEFDGIDQDDGLIAEAIDEATGISDEVMTIGNILTIRGSGLKIEADDDKKAQAGVYFEAENGGRVKAKIIAVNEPRTLKILVPEGLNEGENYRILIYTQSSSKGHGFMLKTMREMHSDFCLTVQREGGHSDQLAMDAP